MAGGNPNNNSSQSNANDENPAPNPPSGKSSHGPHDDQGGTVTKEIPGDINQPDNVGQGSTHDQTEPKDDAE